MRLSRFTILVVLMALISVLGMAQPAKRTVKGNILTSSDLPKVAVSVDAKFRYLGKFDFVIPNMATGQRYIFVDADAQKRVRRMFIAQFEAILPDSAEFYRYDFSRAGKIGSIPFRHNTYAFGNSEQRKTNPDGEGVLTVDFLQKKGFSLSDEWMMSRFVTVPDKEKKHEMILFYLEEVAPTGQSVSKFYVDDRSTDIWKEISIGLTERSKAAFKVIG
ncbi:MAG: hypothetical protein AB7J13_08345 [Pyrinomonadaceae bacterium]